MHGPTQAPPAARACMFIVIGNTISVGKGGKIEADSKPTRSQEMKVYHIPSRMKLDPLIMHGVQGTESTQDRRGAMQSARECVLS